MGQSPKVKKEPILQLKNVTKNFDGVKALKKGDFELQEGEVHALVGENGAGKSTMMNIVGGLLKNDSGEILLSGEPLQLHSSRDAQEKGITFIHQELSLYPDLDVVSNIFIEDFANRKYSGIVNKKKYYLKALEIMKKIELDFLPTKKIKELSMGERQMVEIARAYTRQTKILVLDEPTSSLTDKEITVLFQLIRRLTSQGVAVIYISHKLEEIFEIADRITVLRDGETVGTFISKELDQKTLIRHMIGRGMDEQYPPRTHTVGNEVLLRVKGLGSEKLDDLDFEVRRGEVLGFTGQRGSGRTEAARAIFGLDRFGSGKVTINGKKVTIFSPKKAIEQGIGFVTENRREEGLMLEKSIKENVVLANLRKYLKNYIFMQNRNQNEEVEQWVKSLSIKTSSIHQLAKNLSGGNQQKTVIAKWLLTKAKLLILDEPTRGIDVGVKYEIYKLVDKLAVEGVGIIFISSEISEVLGVCDSVIVMRKGKVVCKMDIAEATQENIMNIAQGGGNNE